MSAHGTRAKYVNEACRCKKCRRANAAYFRDYKRRAAERAKAAA